MSVQISFIMAFICLGQCFFATDAVGSCSKVLMQCGLNLAFCSPFACCCSRTLNGMQAALNDPKLLRRDVFVADFWDSRVAGLKRKHRRLRAKYGDYNVPTGMGLGMEDEEVKERFAKVSATNWGLLMEDCAVGWKWCTPAAINGLCCFCKDITFVQEKISSGEAYEVGCFGPFFKPPSPQKMTQIQEEEKVGRNGELIVIMSSPGDHHDWYGSPGRKNVHSTFESYASRSGSRVLFCPIQMGIKDALGRIVQPSDPYNEKDISSKAAWRDYLCASIDAKEAREELNLWQVSLLPSW